MAGVGMEGAEKSLQGGSEGSGLSVCLMGAPGCSPAEPSLLSLVGFFGLNLWEIAKGVVVARLGAIRAVSYSSGETEVRDRIMVAGLGAIRAGDLPPLCSGYRIQAVILLRWILTNLAELSRTVVTLQCQILSGQGHIWRLVISQKFCRCARHL